MKAEHLEPIKCVLISDNGFTKIFKLREDVDLFLSKAVDEDTDKHYMVATIREIKELNAHGIQFPFEYETESLRDSEYDKWVEAEAIEFLEFAIQFIKDKEVFKEEEARKIALMKEKEENQDPQSN
jgi:hypothetical protein